MTRMVEFSFGWNKKLDEAQRSAYHQSIVHALEYAENGDKVTWYKQNASGYSVPVYTWPNSNGYCRRLHLNVVAYNKQKSMAVTACYNNLDSNWTWYRE
jgi:surface antigen